MDSNDISSPSSISDEDAYLNQVTQPTGNFSSGPEEISSAPMENPSPQVMPANPVASEMSGPNGMPQANQQPGDSLVNVKDQETGQIGSLPASKVPGSGYLPISDQEAESYLNKQKYGTTGQQIIGLAENALRGATANISPIIENKILGIPTADIAGRAEELPPLPAFVSTAIGFALSPISKVFGAAGNLGTKILGLGAPTGFGAFVGSQALKGAIEASIFQGTDEVAKAVIKDPSFQMESVVPNIGLAGVLGGGLGAALSPAMKLWEVVQAPKANTVLKAIMDKANGMESTPAAGDNIVKSLTDSGLPVSPALKSAITGNLGVQDMANNLSSSSSESGANFRQSISDTKNAIGDYISSIFGKKTADIPSEISDTEAGETGIKSFVNEFKAKSDPIEKVFDSLEDTYKDVPLVQDRNIYAPEKNPYLPADEQKIIGVEKPGTTSSIKKDVLQLASDQGWDTSPSSDIMKEVNRVSDEIPLQKSVGDLVNYRTQIDKNTFNPLNPELNRAGALMKNIVTKHIQDVVSNEFENAPELLTAHKRARDIWSNLNELKETMNDRLHVGGGSIDSFLNNISQMKNEAFLRRLSGVNDAQTYDLLKTHFPQTSSIIKEHQIDTLLNKALDNTSGTSQINAEKVLRQWQSSKMSPERKNFLLDQPGQQMLQSIFQAHENLPHSSTGARINNSIAAINRHVTSGALGIATAILQKSKMLGFIMTPLLNILGKEIPDAVRLSLLKFLGNPNEINPTAFKSMASFISSAYRAKKAIDGSVKKLFQSGSDILPNSLITYQNREKLKNQIEKYSGNPTQMFSMGGQVGYYLPDHSQALGHFASNAVGYLQSIKPNEEKENPLDETPEISNAELDSYHRALDIAQQPLLTLQHIKDEQLLPEDIKTMKSIYPSLYGYLNSKIMEELGNHVADGGDIPYAQKLMLSQFLGQPLDSTMTPQALLSAQVPQIQQAPQAPNLKPKHSMKSLNDFSQIAETPLQAREMQKSSKG